MAIALSSCATVVIAEESDDTLVEMVVTLLGDADKDVRALGLDQVRTAAPGEAATKEFAAQLSKLAPDAQVGLLGALADRGDATARDAVLQVLSQSQAEHVTTAAILALGSLGSAADVPLLCTLLETGAANQQAAARASLVRLGGADAAAAIAVHMKQSPSTVHVSLIEILTERRALETVPEIVDDAVDVDATVRTAAMIALGQLAGPDHISGMVEGVLRAQPGKEREAAERAVAMACLRVEDADERAEPLLAAFESRRPPERAALLSTLGRVGGTRPREIIEAAIADPDPKMHELGLRALCNWPDASIAQRLIELVKADAHAAHQAMALRALIRVAPLPDDRPAGDRLRLLQQAFSMCTRDDERLLALSRASAVRIPETLAFVAPFLDQAAFAQQACETVVELAHHRALREASKADFDRALDKVVQVSNDPIVVDRAKRYKQGLTWVRPTPTAAR